MEELRLWIENFLLKHNWSELFVPYISFFVLAAITILLLVGGVYLTRFVLNNTVKRVMLKTKNTWDDLLIKHKFLNAISLIMVIIILKIAIPTLFGNSEDLKSFFEKLVDIYFVFVIFKILISILKATEEVLIKSKLYVDKPIQSYFQLIRIVLVIIAFIFGLSILISKSPVYLLTAFGALSAVLLLIFKDTILGLVASIQISTNDMIRIGDWVEMPKFNADGSVMSINLNTVKIQNWDNTITTVPTYYFVTESFKNFRGMVKSGGRRIKRTLRISVNTVRFVDKEMRENFLKYELIHDYIVQKQSEIDKDNQIKNIDTQVLINGRRMTNIGVFRVYVQKYLENHPGIRKDMTLLARLKEPNEVGIPIEVYCFANSVGLKDFETTQSDIFDHLFAAAPFFGLEIFQNPAGRDFRALGSSQQSS